MHATVLVALARAGSGPLVVVDGHVFAGTRDPGGAGQLTTAGGQLLQLHLRGSYAVLQRHHVLLNARQIRARAEAELARGLDPLEAFLDLARRYRVLTTVGAQPSDPVPSAKTGNLSDPVEVLRAGPWPPVPEPCVLEGDILYLLQAGDRRPPWIPRRPRVLLGTSRRFCVTRTPPLPLGMLEMAAEAHISQALGRSALPGPGALPRCPLPELTGARTEIVRTGAVRRGALLYLPGEGRLGHLLPSGFSTHGRTSTGTNVAVTILWPGLPEPAQLRPYRQLRTGRWEQIRLPHGVCLGTGPQPIRVTPTLYLEWAAGRIATNRGKWHESDG